MSEAGAAAAGHGETVVIDTTGVGRFQAEARVGSASFVIDEPVSAGGLGTGPNPFDLLSAALGACTAMTVRLYAERKGWPLQHVRVRATHHRGALQARDRFSLEIGLEGDLDEARRARLMDIAARCPVHLSLERGADVSATLLADQPDEASRAGGEHMKTMEEACSS